MGGGFSWALPGAAARTAHVMPRALLVAGRQCGGLEASIMLAQSRFPVGREVVAGREARRERFVGAAGAAPESRRKVLNRWRDR